MLGLFHFGTMKINTCKRLRFELGMRQVELAKELGVTQPFISQIENDQCRLPADKAKRLRKIFIARNGNTAMAEMEKLSRYNDFR